MDIDDGIISNVQLAVIGMWTLVGPPLLTEGLKYSVPLFAQKGLLVLSANDIQH